MKFGVGWRFLCQCVRQLVRQSVRKGNGAAQHSIGGRLLVFGFGLNLLLMFIVGIYIFVKLVDFRDASVMLYQHPFVVSNTVKDIDIEILLMHRQLQSMVWAETPAEVDKDVAELKQRENIVLQHFELVSDRYLGNKDDVHAALQAFLDWRDIYNDAVRLLREGKNREAAAAVAIKGDEQLKRLEQQSRQLTEFADDEATHLYGHSLSGQKHATLVVSVLLGLAIFVALGTSLLVLRLEHRRVREIREHLHLIDQNIHIATLLADRTIADITHSLCRYLGVRREEVLGQPCGALFGEDECVLVPDEAWNVAASGMVWEADLELPISAFGGSWASVAIHPVANRAGVTTGFKVILTDITHEKEVERLSQVDPLTSLYNRRHFHQLFDQQIRLARRNRQLLEFVIFDIDYFKEYNDSLGHPAGDLLLQRIAGTLREILRRPDDYIFRLGGDEFGVLLSLASDAGRAGEYAEVIRRQIESMDIEHLASKAGAHVTASVGGVVYVGESIPGAEVIFADADAALYEAKSKRNCAVVRNYAD